MNQNKNLVNSAMKMFLLMCRVEKWDLHSTGQRRVCVLAGTHDTSSV